MTKAIVRKPGKNFNSGITTANLGKPDFDKALYQHSRYVDALKSCGADVIVLEADERFPDGCFVEDTAIILPGAAIITNPGAETRSGETESLAETLKEHKELIYIKAPGTIEGGDVMRIDNHYFVGLSARTNEEGARQFGEILIGFGHTMSIVPLGNVLHLKTGVNFIGKNRLVCIEEFSGYEMFKGFEILKLKPEENYAANCLRVGSRLIIPKGFNFIKSKLIMLGYDLIELEMTEFQKMDGGLTCLSLLF